MALQEYARKRHFERTPEPRATRAPRRDGRSFVVQKHRASHLHYDFRLELEGTLKSWAVPKGPCLDPTVKRLAMHVEDHPVDYASFEGVIPEGEYGGGTVMLWDRGTWEPIGNPHEGYHSGKLKFILHGEKLRGAWMLVRTDRKTQYVEQRHWLLFKERDKEARPLAKGDILDEARSVATARTLDEIAADRDRVWKSNRAASNGKPKRPSAPKKVPVSRPRVSTPSINGYDARSQQFAGVRLTSPDRVLYPDEGITKLELANYYRAVADLMLPHIANRPLVLVRCPEGQQKECFYQKHPPIGTPQTLRRIRVREKTKTEEYLVVDDLAGLVSLAQVGALEVHVWGSHADRLERPDRLIFDLDPDPDVPWTRVVASARQIREFLEELGLQSFVKTTGGKGVHLVVPVEPRHDWEEVKSFCNNVADAIVRADPRHYTSNMAKAARTGKIFVDYLRNARGATAIAPYSTRARPGASVSTPLSWKELSARVRADHYTVRNMLKRIASLKHDPWEGIAAVRQGLAKPMQKIASLI